MYHKVPLTLTESQFKKMRAGHPIQLAHHQIGGGGLKHHLMLHPETAKKVAGAVRRGKGVRIHVSPHEFHASGEGIRDFFNKIKESAQWLKNKVIDTPFYQQTVRPIARNLVNQGIENFLPVSARNVAHQAANFAGEKTGAFGLHSKRGRKQKGGKITAEDHAAMRHYAYIPYYESNFNPYSKYKLDSNHSPMVGSMHPAMWPTLPNLPDIGGAVRKQPRAPAVPVHHRKGRGNRGFGGSFRPA